ncbi:MAG: hypothetical protein ACYCOO_00320 [Chitinophagaceae bacterium]
MDRLRRLTACLKFGYYEISYSTGPLQEEVTRSIRDRLSEDQILQINDHLTTWE